MIFEYDLGADAQASWYGSAYSIYLICYIYRDSRFILNVTDEKLVQRVSGRFYL